MDNGTTATYTYNALGQRVEENVSGATEYTYDASGEAIGENNRGDWTAQFFDFQGRHLVHYQNNAAYFIHPTALGSTSQVTDYSGAMAQDELHYPWGQEWAMVGTLQEERFARLRHRDTEANLDPTQFRMFSSDQGRWLSPDPRLGSVASPQALDRYAYVANNPTVRVDPRGDQCCDPFYGCYCDPFLDPYCGGYCDPYFGCGFGFVGGGTDCSYYLQLGSSSDPCDASYGTVAYPVCISAGYGPWANCMRACLIQYDTQNCRYVPDAAGQSCYNRNIGCREIEAHISCAVQCVSAIFFF